MRRYRFILTFLLVTICVSSRAVAANDAVRGHGSSGAAWILLLAPMLVITFLIDPVPRRVRGEQAMAARIMERFEGHRRFGDEHMARVEAQIDRLDARPNPSHLITALASVWRRRRPRSADWTTSAEFPSVA
jgi:hypothetical protein